MKFLIAALAVLLSCVGALAQYQPPPVLMFPLPNPPIQFGVGDIQLLTNAINQIAASSPSLPITSGHVVVGGGASGFQDSANCGSSGCTLPNKLYLNVGSVNPNLGATPGSLGLLISESASGSCGGQCEINLMQVIADTAAVPSGSVFTPFELSHTFGGAAMTGNRASFNINSNLSSTSGNTNGLQAYTAISAQMVASANDNGTGTGVSTAQGQSTGANIIGSLHNGATNFYRVGAAEFNVNAQTGSSAFQKVGIQISELGSDKVNGSVGDTAIRFSNQSGAVGWLAGLTYGSLDTGGAWPFASTAVVETCVNCGTVGSFIDMTGLTVTNNFIKGPGGHFVVDGAGNVTATSINVGAIGLTAGLTSASVTAAGTGYVPGDTVVPSISGASPATPTGLTYLGSPQLLVIDTKVVSATVAAGGSSCTAGTATLTGTTGTGTLFTATSVVSGGAITNPITITGGGQYIVNPTTLTAEPVTGDSCSGAQLNVVMGVDFLQVQNPGYYTSIPNGASGTATQSSTSGSGTGLTATVNFAAQAAYLLPPSQASGTGAAGNPWNTAVGFEALNSFTTGQENTAVGWQALSHVTSGSFNTGVGVNALGSAFTTGSFNTGVGTDAYRNATTASKGVAIGFQAERNALASTENVSVGYQAMMNPTADGGANVAVGYQALLGASGSTGTGDTFVGFGSGNAGNWTTGQNNVAVGNNAFAGITSGNNNVFLGSGSGQSVTSGTSNIAIGRTSANATLTTGARDIIIGTVGCDATSSGMNDTLIVCASTGSTAWLTGSLASGSLSATFGGTLAATAGSFTALSASGTVSGNLAALNNQDQTLSGGANVTANNIGTVSSGTTTIDCGKSPLQYFTNGGAFTLAAPSNDGSCIVLSTNNASAGTITFSGFSVGSNTGDAIDTTNTHKFSISIWRINGTAGYTVSAHQ